MALAKAPIRPPMSIGDNPPDQRRRAARHIAAHSKTAEECAELLAMLGLTAEDGLDREN